MPAVLGGLIEFEVGQGVRASGMWKMHTHTHTHTHTRTHWILKWKTSR